MVIGVPQLEQNVRSATSESLRVLSVEDDVYVKDSRGMSMKGRYEEPERCWQA